MLDKIQKSDYDVRKSEKQDRIRSSLHGSLKASKNKNQILATRNGAKHDIFLRIFIQNETIVS